MKRLLLASVCLAFFVPAVASASSVTSDHARQYAKDYDAVRAQFGSTEAGCRLIAEAGHRSTCHQRADDGAVSASIAVLERDLAPPPMSQAGDSGSAGSAAVPASSSTTVSQTGDSGTTSSGSYSIPSSIVQCESGGNYSAVNPSSGAGGAYQIMPETWAEYGGTGAPQDAPPAEQDAIAGRIAASAGLGAWSCAR